MLLFTLAMAQDDPCAPPILEYRHNVELASDVAGTVTERFRFPAPPGSCERIVLPKRLEDMQLEGADLIVLDGGMRRLSSMNEGEMLVVSGSRELSGRALSGEIVTPRFPVEFMVVEVYMPADARVSIWTAPEAKVEVRKKGDGRYYRATYNDVGGRLVWSTETDWWKVGQDLEGVFSNQVVTGRDLPKLGGFVEGLDTLGLDGIRTRVEDYIKLDRLARGLDNLRPLSEVIESRLGSPAERVLALLTLYRAAGFEAVPVVVRPEQIDDPVLSVPGLASFEFAALRVRDAEGTIHWIDPKDLRAPLGTVPHRMRGAVVLAADDLPQLLADNLRPDGTVTIKGTMELDYTGAADVDAEVVFDQDAAVLVRQLIGPLSQSVREQWLSDLITNARPDAENIELSLFGIDDPTKPLGMKLAFDDRLDAQNGGKVGGTVPAVLALQLARVLPSNVQVEESLVIAGKKGLRPWTVTPIEDSVDPTVLVHRGAALGDESITLHTLGIRPRRNDDDPNAGQVLFRESERGPRVDLFYAASGGTGKQLRKSVPEPGGWVLEAMHWYRADDSVKAEKALKGALKSASVADVTEALRRLVPFGEYRPWEFVWQAATDTERLAMVEAIEATGDRREAWRRATLLIESEDARLATLALVKVARIQGVKPLGNVDPEAKKAWREPLLLLQRAVKVVDERLDGETVLELEAGFAAELLSQGKCDMAREHVERLEDDEAPRLRALVAEWRACQGELGATAEIPELLEASGWDPHVLRTAVRAYQKADNSRAARRWAVFGARLLGSDPQAWMRASDLAVRAGDLETAVYAARKASDLAPNDTTYSIPLQLLASLLGDTRNADVGSQRANGFRVSKEPLPVDIALAEQFIEPHQWLAFLEVRDDEVLADAALLRKRLELHEQVGDRLGMQRDAGWLVKRHEQAKAAVAMFRANADTVWSTKALATLGDRLRNEDARSARLEVALLTGIADPYADAKALGDHPSAEVLRKAKEDPVSLIAGTPWPLALVDPVVDAPFGFEQSELLSTLHGVEGFTNRDANVSVMASKAGDMLPPPVAGVFELGETLARFGPIEILGLEGKDTSAFVARQTVGPITWWGFAATPQLARFALTEAVNAQGAR